MSNISPSRQHTPAPWDLDLEAQSEEQAPLLASSISSGHISDTTGGQREERSALGRLERRPFYGSIVEVNLPRGNQSRGPITTALAPALSAPQRTEALLASLERERQIVRTIEQDIKKLHYADTISLVMSLDFNQMGKDEFSGEVGNLAIYNQGESQETSYSFPEAPFVLNKNEGERTPFEMNLLPLEGEEGVQPYPITPPLALKNLQGSRRGESHTCASNSDPTAAENRIIRAHLRGALEAYYGEEQLSHCPAAANLLDPAHQEEPIRHRDLYSIIDALGAPSVKGELKRLREQYRVLSPQELENLQQLLSQINPLEAQRVAQDAHHALDHPEEALTRFLYHGAQTAARGGGVLLGAAAVATVFFVGISDMFSETTCMIGIRTDDECINFLKFQSTGISAFDFTVRFILVIESIAVMSIYLGMGIVGIAVPLYAVISSESLRRARAALNDLSGQSAQEALSTLQEAQAKDEETLAALRTMVEQQRGELSLHQLSPLEPPPLAAGEKIRAPRASVSNLSSASPNALEREDSGEIKFPEEEVLPATSSPESKREAVVRGSSQLGDSIISLLEAQCHYRAELIRTLAQKIKGEERRKELFLERIRPVIRGL